MNARKPAVRATHVLFAISVLTACARQQQPSFVPAGEARLDIEGTYATKVTELRNMCGYYPRVSRSDVEVTSIPNSTTYRLIVDGLTYDFALKRNGAFSTKTLRTTENASAIKRTISGRFDGQTFSAKLELLRTQMATCDVTVLIEGTRRGW